MKIEKRIILTTEMKDRKNKGYKYVVTYNNTDKFLYFKDRFFKTEKGAIQFYESLSTEMRSIYSL